MSGIQVVWFKRDLRTVDHRPLAAAARAGSVLPLYVVEPALWRQPDRSARQWAFTRECLVSLRAQLADLGLPLIIRRGEALQALQALRRSPGFSALWSHQETGNDWTYRRDLAVAEWAREHGVAWTELPQHGVIRGLRSRTGWSRRWDAFMAEPITPPPDNARGVTGVACDPLPESDDLGLAADACPDRQPGGRAAAVELLTSFLSERGEAYHREMSSPVTAWQSCSRLSPHLAAGTLGVREAAQATWRRQRAVRALPKTERKTWVGALSAFIGRLHWHCHFMQKLELDPGIEFRNIHSGYDGLREHAFDPERFEAWRCGRTGFPFVDACMRYLHHTGWINFRMRAMLQAFAAYHLWLHWRETGLHLARLFTDYEPGIHWSQAQMQSGTTGINAVRIYNPVKQSRDQDPKARFIRAWVPELAGVPDAHIHEPWNMSEEQQALAGCRLGYDYPERIVDHIEAARAARKRIHAVRRSAAFRAEADSIHERHGSRKRGSR